MMAMTFKNLAQFFPTIRKAFFQLLFSLQCMIQGEKSKHENGLFRKYTHKFSFLCASFVIRDHYHSSRPGSEEKKGRQATTTSQIQANHRRNFPVLDSCVALTEYALIIVAVFTVSSKICHWPRGR